VPINDTIKGTATAKQYKVIRDCVGQTDIVPALRPGSPEYNRKESSSDNNFLDYLKKKRIRSSHTILAISNQNELIYYRRADIIGGLVDSYLGAGSEYR
jgi:hypothetical protein